MRLRIKGGINRFIVECAHGLSIRQWRDIHSEGLNLSPLTDEHRQA